jgi:hypothetical protein
MENKIRFFYVKLLVVLVFIATGMLTTQQKYPTSFTNEKTKTV